MSCDCECEDTPGTGCSKCLAEDSGVVITDADTGEVLAGELAETPCSCTCEDTPGTCCSKCITPDSETDLGSWDPGVLRFSPSQFAAQTVYPTGAPIFWTFTVYPGEGLPWVIFSWLSDFDWPEPTEIDPYGEPILFDEWGDSDPI